MTNIHFHLKSQLRLMHGDDIALGPGKADLLAAILETGSISSAGRALGLSYRRAWLMADMMNRCFRQPLIETSHGGARGGGARLTPFGRDILARYRAAQTAMAELAARHFSDLDSILAPDDGGPADI